MRFSLSAYVLRQGQGPLRVSRRDAGRATEGIKEFKKGVGIIARELNVPIVPVAIRGTYEMLATGQNVPAAGKGQR